MCEWLSDLILWQNIKIVTLTCSPVWRLGARCSWRGSVANCWCCHTVLTWVVGPTWACSHTIATCRNTLGLTVSCKYVKSLQSSWLHPSDEMCVRTTNSIQTLVVRTSSFSFWGEIFWKNNVNSWAHATTHVKIKNAKLNLTYQRDEVGECHLDVYLSDVTTPLHGPDVLVVALHQILEKLTFKVDCWCCAKTTHIRTRNIKD